MNRDRTVALLVAAGLIASQYPFGARSPISLAVVGALAAVALAVAVRPALRHRWETNVAVGALVAAFGVSFAVAHGGAVALAGGTLLALLGAATVANHLGLAPWSDHPRRV